MNEFKTYHPIVNFIYFVFVIGFSMFFMHPICLMISFACALLYLMVLKGKGTLKSSLRYIILAIFAMAIINPAVNHEGVTILTYLPSGNPLTLESILYGISAAVMISSVICWFSCFNAVMTSDKLIYLFGRIIPSLSLVLSMTLRFIPRFSAQVKTVINAQKALGRDMSSGSVIKRAKNGLAVLSIMVSWALENSIETADSMKSRGYGLFKRTAFSIYTFDKRDKKALSYILALSLYVLAGGLLGHISFTYFPSIKGNFPSFYGITVFWAYLALCVLPVIIEALEVRKWKSIKSAI